MRAMRLRIILMSLLGSGLLVSCQSHKSEVLADNGGYSDGDYYGDSSTPAPSGYPRDGQTFATNDGVPFGHNDPVRMEDPVVPVEPVVAERRPAPPAPSARSAQRVAVSRPAPDPYDEAYGEGGAYASDGSLERAVVTPYVERAVPPPPPTPVVKPKTSGTATKGNAKKAVAGSGTKSTAKKKGTVAVSGKKSGTTVKAVYKPSSNSKSVAKKKAPAPRVHTVKRGDSLSKLAGRYGVTVAQLKKRNQLTSDTIVVGKRLTID